MGQLMDFVAGDTREILLAISIDDLAGLGDRSRFDGHLSLGAGLHPRWLDLFSAAARTATRRSEPGPFEAARRALDGPGEIGDRVVERIDPAWIGAIARVSDRAVDAVAGCWIDLIEAEIGEVPRDEKPSIRQLAGDLVRFCRAADRAPDVLFAWSL
jgi:hypothetical protein